MGILLHPTKWEKRLTKIFQLGRVKKGSENPLQKAENTAPIVMRIFLCPKFGHDKLYLCWGGEEYNTRKGNNSSRLSAVFQPPSSLKFF